MLPVFEMLCITAAFSKPFRLISFFIWSNFFSKIWFCSMLKIISDKLNNVTLLFLLLTISLLIFFVSIFTFDLNLEYIS